MPLWALRNSQMCQTEPAYTLRETTGDEKKEEEKDDRSFHFCSVRHKTRDDILHNSFT